jgi:hypothetical protein
MTPISVRFQVGGHTAAAWAASNPVLLEREIATETDTRKMKIGDGATRWNNLPYAVTWGGIAGALADQPDLALALSQLAPLDTGGKVPRANLPTVTALSAYREGTTSFMTIGPAFTTVPLPTVSIDTAGGYNASTGLYTVSDAGTYLALGGIRPVDGTPAGAVFGVGVGIATAGDNREVAWATVAPATGSTRSSVKTYRVFSLPAAQQVRLYAYADSTLGIVSATLSLFRIS